MGGLAELIPLNAKNAMNGAPKMVIGPPAPRPSPAMLEIAIHEDAKEHDIHEAENNPELQLLPLGGLLADVSALNDIGPTATEDTD